MTSPLVRLTERSRTVSASALRPISRTYEPDDAPWELSREGDPLAGAEGGRGRPRVAPSDPAAAGTPAVVDGSPVARTPAIEPSPLPPPLMPRVAAEPVAARAEALTPTPASRDARPAPPAARPREEAQADPHDDDHRPSPPADATRAEPGPGRMDGPGRPVTPSARRAGAESTLRAATERRVAATDDARAEVHIHIGRIDVRTPAVPRAETRPPRRPAASLDDYLARRRGQR